MGITSSRYLIEIIPTILVLVAKRGLLLSGQLINSEGIHILLVVVDSGPVLMKGHLLMISPALLSFIYQKKVLDFMGTMENMCCHRLLLMK